MKTLAIIGLGLIGSSVARGLKGKYKIIGYNRHLVTAQKALKEGFVDVATDKLSDAVHDADIIMLCTPMSHYESVMNQISEYLQPGAIVTDVGSVKTPAIFQIFRNIPPGVHIVPAHPIAGKETSGYDAGEATLFKGKKVIITPLPKTPMEINLAVENIWKDLGAMTESMTASEHDRIYGCVSHAPQMLAYAYKMAIGHKKYNLPYAAIIKGRNPSLTLPSGEGISSKTPLPEGGKISLAPLPEGGAGGGSGDFKTFMRISHSRPDIWVDIFQLNRAHIFKFLEKMFNGLSHIDKFSNQVELREKLGGEEKKFKLTGDKKLDAATVVFPALLGNLLLFCIEDEFENQVSRSFSAASIHSSLAMLDDPPEKKKMRNFADYAGSGLRDFSICSLYDVSDIVDDYADEIQLLKILLHRKIFEISAAVESDSAELLGNKLKE